MLTLKRLKVFYRNFFCYLHILNCYIVQKELKGEEQQLIGEQE